MPTRIVTFDDAIRHAKKKHERVSVLLGNGFSIDYAPEIFHYDSLAEEAQLDGLSVDKDALFASIRSSDFETVVDRLNTAARLMRLYGQSDEAADTVDADALVVRNGLADVLASRHPQNASSISAAELSHARTFLHHFGDIFTLSYDLLLYWVINRVAGPDVVRADGFGQTDAGLRWQSERPQHVHFLHGALHMFVDHGGLMKLNYSGHGPIVEELRDRLARNQYPLIVTEGSCDEKARRIRRSRYLRTTFGRFVALDGALFLHGVSMSANDDHIFAKIEAEDSAISAVYVGVHGDPDSARARALMQRVEQIRERRQTGGGGRLGVRFYDAATAHGWRGAGLQ